MSNRHSRRSDQRETASEFSPRLVELLRQGLLLATTVLLVVSPLVPSEGVATFGVNAPVTMGWLVLLTAWAGWSFLEPARRWTWDWSDVCLGAVVAWHSLSGLVALATGDAR